jgi:ferredoxin-NADP reductase
VGNRDDSGGPGGPMQRRLRVDRIESIAEDVVAVELIDPDGAELEPWHAGAHIELWLPSGKVRQYSLCGDSADRHRYRVAVLRVADGRGGSIEIHDTDLVGHEITVRGPRNHFPVAEADWYLLLAGGIGITPIYAIARELEQAGRDWTLVYGARTAAHMAFADELTALGPERVSLRPQDEHGLLDIKGTIAAMPAGTAVYCCGPEPMIAIAESVARELGVDLHFERFAASPETITTVEGDFAFELELRDSGIVTQVAVNQSILDVVLQHLPAYPYSCLAGECGSCEARVIQGAVDHRDDLLTEEERNSGESVMVCVSRAAGPRLVLDL